MKNLIFLFSFTASSLVSFNLFAEQEVVQSNTHQQVQQENEPFSDAELAQMLAPIALYPDSLLTHILIASTYPIEIIEAHRWLIKNDQLSTAKAAQSVKDFNWDASVKALVPFDRILSRLSEDLTWTQQLGDAFLQDESRLLESIQTLRKQADFAGNLEKMDNMDVSYEDSNIVIEPIEKEIVYVPYYDTRMVYGNWHSASYPPVYWKPHHSVYVNHYNPFYFHSGIHISFNYFFNAFHWHNRQVVVVNSNHSKYRYYEQRPKHLIANGGYAKRWTHKPAHRKGVAYRTKHTRSKYNNKRLRVLEKSNKSHYAVQNKIQRKSKVNVSVINNKPNKRSIKHASKTHVSKKHVFMDKSKKFTSQKIHHNKARVKNENSKKVKTKTYKKSPRKNSVKSDDTPSRKNKYNSSRKQSKRSTSAKNNHSKSVKIRNK
jgi:hypothetical protein